MNVTPDLCAKMIDGIRNVFNDYIPDVWVHLDHYKGDKAGPIKGFGVSLQSESTSGVLLSHDLIFDKEEHKLPVEMGKLAATHLLEEIYNGSVVDTSFQWIVFLLMSISSSEEVS